MIKQLLWGFACLHLLPAFAAAAQGDPESILWERLQTGGYVLLLQHASAPPATPRPPGLSHLNCGGHDSLSGEGQVEAHRLKEKLQRHGISIGRVLTSHDCRCIQTAGIVFGLAEPWSIIDDIVNDDTTTGAAKSAALREAVSRWSSNQNLVLISHQSNFQQAFAAYPARAQLLVIEPLGDDGFRLLGRLHFD